MSEQASYSSSQATVSDSGVGADASKAQRERFPSQAIEGHLLRTGPLDMREHSHDGEEDQGKLGTTDNLAQPRGPVMSVASALDVLEAGVETYVRNFCPSNLSSTVLNDRVQGQSNNMCRCFYSPGVPRLGCCSEFTTRRLRTRPARPSAGFSGNAPPMQVMSRSSNSRI